MTKLPYHADLMPLAEAAAHLKAAKPELYDGFLGKLGAYSASLRDELLTARPEMFQAVQGRAYGAKTLVDLLADPRTYLAAHTAKQAPQP